jgi:hypothetical protein
MASGGTERPAGDARRRSTSGKAVAAGKTGADRRKHPRVPAPSPVPFRIIDEAGHDESFRLVDLSECGARIQVRTAIPPMTRIQVALMLHDGGARVDTSGVVVWCHPTEDAYDTGVFFPDLGEEERRLLRDLVRRSS